MPKTQLSVNLNKVALIRNSRGANYPDLIKVAIDCENFGANGITLHPRPDERHARYSDIPQMKKIVRTELNVEGYPSERFMNMIIQNKPDQCTLVPDPPDAITSDTGWNTVKHRDFLNEICSELRVHGIRSSIFVNPEIQMIEGAKKAGVDRIELYTGPYAHQFEHNATDAIAPYISASRMAMELELGINAGHDLNLRNLTYFIQNIPNTLEVSIGHALICDALYFGLKNTIHMYLNALEYN